MAEKEGELLKMWVKKSGLEVQRIADILGLSARTSVYYVFKQHVLSFEYKELLKKEGFDIDTVRKMSNDEEKSNDTDVLRLQIEDLKQEIAYMKQDIAFIKGTLNPAVKLTTKKEKHNT